MKIRREAPASAKAKRLSGTPHESPRRWTEPSDNRNNLYQSSSGAFEESSMSFFHTHSTVLGRPLAFSGAPAMTLTISKGLCNVSVGVSNAFVQLDPAHSSTLSSMHYLWNHQLLYAGADVFGGYSFIRHQLSKPQYPVTIYALEGVTHPLMWPFPFTLFAHKFRWISGMGPHPPLPSPTSFFNVKRFWNQDKYC